MNIVTVYAVFANAEEAERIGRSMVEERLAACVNVLGPISSIFRWQDKIEQSAEVAALFKTTAKAADRLIARIAELHSFGVPCIEVWPVDKVWSDYSDWVEANVPEPPRIA